MPTARTKLCTSAVDGKIYAIGGSPDFNKIISTVEEYDPVTDEWTKKSDMPTARVYFSTSVVNGKIYAIGGQSDWWALPTKTLSTVEEYDPIANKWTRKADMPTARMELSTSAVNGRIYAIGGWSLGLGKGNILSTVEEYDPIANKWTEKADMPNERQCLSTSVVNGKIYAIGGTIPNPDPKLSPIYVSTTEEYDPTTDTWTKKSDMPTIRSGVSTGVVNGKIYAIGGYKPEGNTTVLFSKVEEYDPVTDTWTKRADMPTTRIGLSASVINGKIYVIGGARGPGDVCSTVEEYDPGTGQSINLKGKLPTTWGETKTALNR
jgi:N-acetylneuraminic acid mutarotase